MKVIVRLYQPFFQLYKFTTVTKQVIPLILIMLVGTNCLRCQHLKTIRPTVAEDQQFTTSC